MAWKGGSLKRSLPAPVFASTQVAQAQVGMASPAFTIPKASGFEAATQPWEDNLQIQA
jgi:hypothetical protein